MRGLYALRGKCYTCVPPNWTSSGRGSLAGRAACEGGCARWARFRGVQGARFGDRVVRESRSNVPKFCIFASRLRFSKQLERFRAGALARIKSFATHLMILDESGSQSGSS
jgi:hypothetical protein